MTTEPNDSDTPKPESAPGTPNPTPSRIIDRTLNDVGKGVVIVGTEPTAPPPSRNNAAD